MLPLLALVGVYFHPTEHAYGYRIIHFLPSQWELVGVCWCSVNMTVIFHKILNPMANLSQLVCWSLLALVCVVWIGLYWWTSKLMPKKKIYPMLVNSVQTKHTVCLWPAIFINVTYWRQDLRLGYEAVGQIISAALCDDLCPCDLISCDLLWWLRHGHHPREQACHIPHVDGECCCQVLCLDQDLWWNHYWMR